MSFLNAGQTRWKQTALRIEGAARNDQTLGTRAAAGGGGGGIRCWGRRASGRAAAPAHRPPRRRGDGAVIHLGAAPSRDTKGGT